MGPYSEVVLVCMHVRKGFTTEVYEFTYSVVPSGTCPSWCAKLTQSSRYNGRLRGETTTPGQRTRPELQPVYVSSPLLGSLLTTMPCCSLPIPFVGRQRAK